MLVSQSNVPNSVATAVGVQADTKNPIPRLRFEFRYPKLTGAIPPFNYTAIDVKVVVELTPNAVPPSGPSPEAQRVPSTNWDRVIGTGLIAGAVVVVVGTLVEDFFVCGSLTLDGAEAGGTFGPAWLILAASLGVGDRGIFETCRLGVHHEFSSLIWARMPDLQVTWSTLMPSGWRPAHTNAEVLSHRDEQEDRRDGFLTAYGSTTLENDFNTYAETIFAFPERLVSAARKSPIVERKVSIALHAYERLDPRLRETFTRQGLDGLRGDGAFRGDVGISVSPVKVPGGTVVRPGEGDHVP